MNKENPDMLISMMKNDISSKKPKQDIDKESESGVYLMVNGEKMDDPSAILDYVNENMGESKQDMKKEKGMSNHDHEYRSEEDDMNSLVGLNLN